MLGYSVKMMILKQKFQNKIHSFRNSFLENETSKTAHIENSKFYQTKLDKSCLQTISHQRLFLAIFLILNEKDSGHELQI